MKLLFDENLSPKHVEALRPMGFDVEHVLSHVEQGTQDEELFVLARGLNRWYVTKDAMIRHRKHEQQAYRQAGIGVVIYTGRAQRKLRDEQAFLLATLELLEAEAPGLSPPFVLEITDQKKLRRLE